MTASAGTPGRGDIPPGIQSLVELASVWYWETDAQHRFTAVVTPEYDRGRPFATHLGRCRWELPGATALGGSWYEHRATMDQHRPFHDFRYFVRPPAHAPRYVSSSGAPVFSPDGRFIGYRGTSRDITDQWVAREQLREAQMLLRVAARLSRVWAWSMDVATRTLTWSEQRGGNGSDLAWHALPADEALRIYAPGSARALVAAYDACVTQGTPIELELEAVVAREPRWIHLSAVAVRAGDGRVVRVQGAYQDVTATKRASEAHRLLASRLASTLESLPFGFGTVDRHWYITFVNAAAEQILRRPRETLVGRLLWEAFPGLEHTVFGESYQHAMRERVVEEFEGYFEPLTLWAHVRAFPSEDGIAITFSDVSRTWQAQQEVARLNAELEQRVALRTAQLEAAYKDLETFAYTVAHDLRAPLAAITGYSRALAASGEQQLGTKSSHYLERIQAAAQRLDQMTEAILSLSKFNRVQPRSRPIDLAEIARGCLAMLQESQPHRSVELRIADTLPAQGDPALLHVVMDNLLSNAWKYTGPSQYPVIEVNCQCGDEVVYFVRDNGVGFDPAEAARLFEPFSRMHGAEFEGTGIGLATVHRLVSRHGGRVWAQAAPGQGATFFFTLPGEPAPG